MINPKYSHFSLFIAVLNVPSNKKKLRFLKFFDFGKNKQQNSKSVSVAVRVFVNEVIFYAQTTLTYVEHPPLDPQKIKRWGLDSNSDTNLI